MRAICDGKMFVECDEVVARVSHESKGRPYYFIVYSDWSKHKVIRTGGVFSSPMLLTERKAVLGAASLLQLLRCSDESIVVVC